MALHKITIHKKKKSAANEQGSNSDTNNHIFLQLICTSLQLPSRESVDDRKGGKKNWMQNNKNESHLTIWQFHKKVRNNTNSLSRHCYSRKNISFTHTHKKKR